jgi:polyhydroxybutyrate depolymerase
MATTTVWCTPTEVARFNNRIHIQTLESFAGINYFAVPTSDEALATQTLTLASSAMASGDMLLITYDPADDSGVAFGCQSSNCRKIQAIRLNTSRKAYLLQLDDVEGEARRALIYPSTRVPRTQASPAVLYFHGHGKNIYELAYDSASLSFHSLWPEAVVVYAEGTPYVGAHGSAPDDPTLGWQLRFPYKHALGQTKDLTYVRQLLAHLRAHHRINNDQVFAVGHSSGGFFTFSLMALMPHEFAKFAVLGAFSVFKAQLVSFDDAWANRAEPLPVTQNDHATLPRPVLYMFGKDDTNFDGQNPPPTTQPGWHATQMSRSRRTLNELLRRNACAVPTGYYWQDSYREFAPTSEFGAKVVWRLYEGGHSWPSEASRWVIDFFQQS